jgi:CopG family transcriptional regulator, nickel-responsive regulator
MAIISISLNEQILKEIDGLKNNAGYAGRSDVIRSAVRNLVAETKEQGKLQGKVDGVLLVVHDDLHTEEVSTTRHKFEKIIKTHIHNQLENHKCLEIFVVSGNAESVTELEEVMRTNRKLGFVKLIVT